MTKTALVPIANGTEEMEAVTIIDVLRRAEVAVTVASVQDLQITASRGVKLAADCLVTECTANNYDLIALPGGMPGAEYMRDCKPLIDMLRTQKAEGRLFAAICASPAVIFAHHGLIDDRRATSYPSTMDKLPKSQHERVVVDGTCITSQGPGTAQEFALELVRQLCGKETADSVASAMVVSNA